MGLVNTKELGQLAQSDGDLSERRATRYFLVEYDTPTDVLTAEAETGGSNPVPGYFDAFPGHTTYLVKSKRGQAHDADQAGRYYWKIQVDYSDRIISPLSVPIAYDWDFSEASETYFFDATGAPVINSAGDPFDSIPEREGGSITLTVSKNVATSFDTEAALSNKNYVNSDSFSVDGCTLDVWQAKFSGIQISGVQLQNTIQYRTLKTVVKFRKDWHDNFADMGYRQVVGGKLIPIVQGQVAVDKPYALSGGVAQPLGTPPDSLTFEPYFTTTFSGSPLL